MEMKRTVCDAEEGHQQGGGNGDGGHVGQQSNQTEASGQIMDEQRDTVQDAPVADAEDAERRHAA